MNNAKTRSGWVIIPDWTRSRSIGYVAAAQVLVLTVLTRFRVWNQNSARKYLAKRRHTQTVLSGAITHPELYIRMLFTLNVIDCGRWTNREEESLQYMRIGLIMDGIIWSCLALVGRIRYS